MADTSRMTKGCRDSSARQRGELGLQPCSARAAIRSGVSASYKIAGEAWACFPSRNAPACARNRLRAPGARPWPGPYLDGEPVACAVGPLRHQRLSAASLGGLRGEDRRQRLGNSSRAGLSAGPPAPRLLPSLCTNRPSALELIMSMSEQMVTSAGEREPTSR